MAGRDGPQHSTRHVRGRVAPAPPDSDAATLKRVPVLCRPLPPTDMCMRALEPHRAFALWGPQCWCDHRRTPPLQVWSAICACNCRQSLPGTRAASTSPTPVFSVDASRGAFALQQAAKGPRSPHCLRTKTMQRGSQRLRRRPRMPREHWSWHRQAGHGEPIA